MKQLNEILERINGLLEGDLEYFYECDGDLTFECIFYGNVIIDSCSFNATTNKETPAKYPALIRFAETLDQLTY